MITVKRIYDEPGGAGDGSRVLADRIWPRGVKKSEAKIDVWAKELAPSNELRKWFHQEPDARFEEFKRRYLQELRGKREHFHDILPDADSITLVTAVKNIGRSHIPVLKGFLEQYVDAPQ
jgi:uncharacterized protein YeaO (DUF488 family)